MLWVKESTYYEVGFTVSWTSKADAEPKLPGSLVTHPPPLLERVEKQKREKKGGLDSARELSDRNS